MSALAVTKMHGTLNDFIVLDARESPPGDVARLARALCDRRGGMGADGLILIERSASAHARMRIINADGSEAEMCGNGMRCAIRFLSEKGEGDHFVVETLAGPIEGWVVDREPMFRVRLNMGTPQVQSRELPFDDAVFVSLGNPHAVVFTEDVQEQAALKAGRSMPEINVHLARVVDEHHMQVRHHERGVGLTHACGTGAVACAAAAIRRGTAQSPVNVTVPGGVLAIEWDGAGDAFLTGAAVRVFDASIDT